MTSSRTAERTARASPAAGAPRPCSERRRGARVFGSVDGCPRGRVGGAPSGCAGPRSSAGRRAARRSSASAASRSDLLELLPVVERRGYSGPVVGDRDDIRGLTCRACPIVVSHDLFVREVRELLDELLYLLREATGRNKVRHRYREDAFLPDAATDAVATSSRIASSMRRGCLPTVVRGGMPTSCASAPTGMR